MRYSMLRVVACALIGALLLLEGVALAQSTRSGTSQIRANDKNGLPAMTSGGAVAFSTDYVFWGTNWAWTETQASMHISSPQNYRLSAKNVPLGFEVTADAAKQSDQQMRWNFQLAANTARVNVIGGGLVFKFDLDTFGGTMGEPALLPDNAGWTWGTSAANRVEMRFEPPLAQVYFEAGKKSEVRAFFYKGTIATGALAHKATLSTGSDIQIAPTQLERYGGLAPSAWPTTTLDWKTSPVDLSFMNAPEKPAGKRGFVKALGDQLQFADGTQARFWGTNVTAYALFNTPQEAVRDQARRLSALGFNLVRLHHHDSPWVNPNIFGDMQKNRHTRALSAVSLDKLDWWIKCLKDEGIYVWLDLHAQRALYKDDGVFSFDEISKGKDYVELKGYNYVNASIQNIMRRFNEAYVTHVNPYTQTAYKDETAIAAMLITNENDVTHHFGNALLPDKKVPNHNQLYMAAAEAFANAKGLPKSAVWRAWEPGPAKLFLNDLEQRFNTSMIEQLRSLGVKVPIATTNSWGNDPLSALPALTTGDVIDAHSYGEAGQLEKNPLKTAGLVHWIAAAQVVDKPLTVTEWNAEPFPAPDRHTLPLYVAGNASLQGWDALMHYAYSQEPVIGHGNASNWHAYNDPALLATLPAAALMYRQGHVKEATSTYVFAPSPELLYGKNVSAGNAAAIRTASEKGKLLVAMPSTKELPWLKASGLPGQAKIMRDPLESQLPADAQEARSDTGELTRNWNKGTYTIDTPRTQATMGWIGGETIALANIQVKALTANATVAVQSLDGAAIDKSKNLLISLGTRALPNAKPQHPFVVEPLDGDLWIQAPPGLKLTRRTATQALLTLAAEYREGRYRVSLSKAQGSSWLFLKAAN